MIKLSEQLKYLCCPKDHHELALGNSSLVCKHCGHEYPVHHDIPNFTFDGEVNGRRITRLSTYPDEKLADELDKVHLLDLPCNGLQHAVA